MLWTSALNNLMSHTGLIHRTSGISHIASDHMKVQRCRLQITTSCPFQPNPWLHMFSRLKKAAQTRFVAQESFVAADHMSGLGFGCANVWYQRSHFLQSCRSDNQTSRPYSFLSPFQPVKLTTTGFRPPRLITHVTSSSLSLTS